MEMASYSVLYSKSGIWRTWHLHVESGRAGKTAQRQSDGDRRAELACTGSCERLESEFRRGRQRSAGSVDKVITVRSML